MKRPLCVALLGTAAVVLAFGLVWAVAIGLWRSSGHVPGGTGLALTLFGLPLVLLAGFVLVRRGLAARRQAGAAAAEPGAEASGEIAAMASVPDADPVLSVVAYAVRLPLGASAEAVADTLAEPPRPRPHPTLKDLRGRPVFAAVVPGLDPAVAAATLPAELATEEQQRALALAAEVFAELVPAALAYAAQMDVPVDLQVRFGLPARWPAAAHGAAQAWLLRRSEAAGWPAGRLTVQTMALDDGPQVLAWLARLGDSRPPTPTVYLVLACDSTLGATTIAAWEQAGDLFDPARRQGRMPGEGAAGLLLAPPSERTTLRLHRVVRDDAAAPAHDCAATSALSTLLQRAQTGIEVPPAAVVADAEDRLTAALAGAVNAQSGECDPPSLLPLASACGDYGAAAALAAVAVAAARAAQAGEPVLVVSLAPRARAALAITPAEPPAASALPSAAPLSKVAS